MKSDSDIETLMSQSLFLPVYTRKQENPLSPLKKLKRYYVLSRTRRQLALLSAEQLDDVGISLEQAQRESQKFFWQS